MRNFFLLQIERRFFKQIWKKTFFSGGGRGCESGRNERESEALERKKAERDLWVLALRRSLSRSQIIAAAAAAVAAIE